MRPDRVVIIAPKRQLPAGVVQSIEDLLVQEFVAQAAIEALDESILLGLARVDVMPGHPVLVGPLQNGPTGKLGAVVTDNASGLSVEPHQRIQLAGYAGARDAGVGGQAQVLPAAVVDQQILQDDIVEHRVGQQALELGVLVFQRLQPGSLGDLHATILGFQLVECRRAETMPGGTPQLLACQPPAPSASR